MQLTAEQKAIVAAEARRIKVQAGAGSGKTSTLVAWAHAHPRRRTLYLAFNKSMQLEGARRFPSHVVAKTHHALAFGPVGSRYKHKLIGNLRPREVADWLQFPGRVGGSSRDVAARWVIETVQAFLASEDETLLPHHVPLADQAPALPSAAQSLVADQLRFVLDSARVLWERMIDPRDAQVGMIHDGYLKLYALSRPRLGYDAILFDEAQDANPVTLQIVSRQSAQQIYVGDPFQAIYGFRGAVDAMTRTVADVTLPLTASFRFGPVIADAATRIIHRLDPSAWALRGLGPVPGLIAVGDPTGQPLSATRPWAILTRTNALLFDRAAEAVTRGVQRLGFVGGYTGYRFDLIEDVYRLFQGLRPFDGFLRLFESFNQLAEYADAVKDREWLVRCEVVLKWTHQIPRLVSAIQAAESPLDRAQIILSTAHRAKGLEFPEVVLGHDFVDLTAKDNQDVAILPREEGHLWYVAVTRARERLWVPFSSWAAFLTGRLTPVSTEAGR